MYSYLLVDDEVLIRKGTLKKIEKLSLPIYCSADLNNGNEAIEYLKNATVDFIITDMDMPEVNGIEFLNFLQSNFPELPIIVISGYRNFDYMQKSVQANAVNYILKPFNREDILQSLKTVLSKLEIKQQQTSNKIEVIANCILGNKTEIGFQSLKELLQEAHTPCLLLLEYWNSTITDPNILFKFNLPDYPLTILIIEKEKIASLSFLKDYLAGVSQPITSIFEVDQTFQQCISALNFRTMESPKLVFYQYNQEIKEPKSIQSIFPYTMEIQYLVESGKKQEVAKFLPEYFFQILEREKITLLTLKKIGFGLLEKIKLVIDDIFHLESNYTLPTVYTELMERRFTFEEVVDFFTTFLVNISESLSYEQIYSSTDIIENVQTYLRLHYRERISLDFIADTFYINQSYLSSLFKEKTGIKYVDYINILRIEEAKNLLAKTTKKTANIARTVGYENEKYFFRVFKKFTGFTPEQFRKSNSNTIK